MKLPNFISDLLLNEDLHNIAYNEYSSFFLGYDIESNKASYQTESYSSSLLSHMPDKYQKWAATLLSALSYDTNTVETEKDYFEILTRS